MKLKRAIPIFVSSTVVKIVKDNLEKSHLMLFPITKQKLVQDSLSTF